MEPGPYHFDSYHTVTDKSTGQIFPPLGIRCELNRIDKSLKAGDGGNDDDLERLGADGGKTADPRRRYQYSAVRSFLSVQGIHLDEDNASTTQSVTEDVLPERFDPNDVKARFTWFGALCLAGIGMFIEAYVIITTGQVKTVWTAQYPACWAPNVEPSCPNMIECCGLFPNTPEVNGVCIPQSAVCNADGSFPSSYLCSESWINSISYSEFAGIMLGMVTFGAIADWIGHVRAGILTAIFMILGISFMCFYDSADVSTLFLVFSITDGLFGMGVGGEYPLTAMQAASHHIQAAQDAKEDDAVRARHRVLIHKAQTARRGETISMVFAMQGLGAVVGSAYLLFLLYFSGQTRTICDEDDTGRNAAGYEPSALNTVWRAFYLVGGTFIFLIFIYRTLIEEESRSWKTLVARRGRQRARVSGHAERNTWKILKFYGPRLVGTGGNWFVLDVAFYGLKLFSGPIFEEINPGGDLIVQNGYLLLYNICGLLGYYGAAYVMDRPFFGRKRFQMASFAVLTVLFATSAAIFDFASPEILIFLYFLSNFCSTFGANTTVYVMAAETYPTKLRGTCHGLSAFCGKLGALVATVLFGTVRGGAQSIFWICAAVSALGVLLTLAFGCDLTNVSLSEHDAQLELFLQDCPGAYQGELNAPSHLSNYELWTGRHGGYDPHWAHKLLAKHDNDNDDHNEAPSSAESSLPGH